MQKILDVNAIKTIIQKHGLKNIIKQTMDRIEHDFSKWQDFDIIPRPAFYVPNGVIELMPTANKDFFIYKCVNGHPVNPSQNKLTISAVGQLNTTYDGYPVFITEMTILTAIRTAATAALAAKYMSRANSTKLAIIGTGAQSEFQIIAHKLIRNIKEIHYYDTDPKAMDKFENNIIKKYPKVKFIRFNSTQKAIKGCDIVVVVTATKAEVQVIKSDWVEKGMHLSGLGGDAPGKTEFEKEVLQLPNSKVVVEFFDQSFIEGEIQKFDKATAKTIVHAEMWEICNKSKLGRENDSEITIFDSVGIGLEDFSILKVIYKIIKNENFGKHKVMVPILDNVKDLYGQLESNIITNKVVEFDAINKDPKFIGDNIYKIASHKKQFKAITKESCMCTVGVWSGAQKYYGNIGLIQIGELINSSIVSLLGEGDRKEKFLYDQIGKISGENYVLAGLDYKVAKSEEKFINRLNIINNHGINIHFKDQVKNLGYEEIIKQASKSFEAKGIFWGISATVETEKFAKKYLTNKNFIGYEIKK